MKVIIHIDETLAEDEFHITCKSYNDEVLKMIHNANKFEEIVAYQEEQECYVPIREILFFETSGREIMLHTNKEVFIIKKKLYELESILPDSFTRISKSSIVNIMLIYSMGKRVGSNGVIHFRNTHKQVYVSRNYYREVKQKLERKRKSYE